MLGNELLIDALQGFTLLGTLRVTLWLLCAMGAVLLLVTSGRWSMKYKTSFKARVGTNITFATGTTLFALSIICAFYVVDEVLLSLSNIWQLAYF